jgi:uncharacterized protein YxjI
MREKLFTIGDDYWIETGGERAFKVNGKALRVRETLVLEGPSGHEQDTIQEKKLRAPRHDVDRAGRQDRGDRQENTRQRATGPILD